MRRSNGADRTTGVRCLARLKEIAVDNEDYDEAKRLKRRLDGIRSVGTRLASLERQKRRAAEAEDYDLAKQLKEEIRRIREGSSRDGASSVDTSSVAAIQSRTGVSVVEDLNVASAVDVSDSGNVWKR